MALENPELVKASLREFYATKGWEYPTLAASTVTQAPAAAPVVQAPAPTMPKLVPAATPAVPAAPAVSVAKLTPVKPVVAEAAPVKSSTIVPLTDKQRAVFDSIPAAKRVSLGGGVFGSHQGIQYRWITPSDRAAYWRKDQSVDIQWDVREEQHNVLRRAQAAAVAPVPAAAPVPVPVDFDAARGPGVCDTVATIGGVEHLVRLYADGTYAAIAATVLA